VVVSLGTGTGEDSTASPAPNFRHVVRDGFIPRLWRSFVSSLDGQKIWRDVWNRLNNETRKDFFRFNVYLSGESPAMDDVERMQELRQCASASARQEGRCRQTGFALVVASFFFELDIAPVFQGGQYYCKGTIRCRLEGQVVSHTLKRLCKTGLTFMTDKDVLGYFQFDEDLCDECFRFRKNVQFFVRHPSDMIKISMACNSNGTRTISGFPQTIQWFMHQQKLACAFPTSMRTLEEPCGACSVARGWRQPKRKLIESYAVRPKRARIEREQPSIEAKAGEHRDTV